MFLANAQHFRAVSDHYRGVAQIYRGIRRLNNVPGNKEGTTASDGLVILALFWGEMYQKWFIFAKSVAALVT